MLLGGCVPPPLPFGPVEISATYRATGETPHLAANLIDELSLPHAYLNPRDGAGYAHPGYAASLSEFGSPRHLRHSDGWVLQRSIVGSPYFDAMGCYPLFFCRDWTSLPKDLQELATDLVSLVLVTDPFADVDPMYLAAIFDRVLPFKEHFVADLSAPAEQLVKKSHRTIMRRALREVEVSVCARPQDHLEDWVELFAYLAARHKIKGLRAFSRLAFDKQLRIPGIVMFEARAGGELIGLDLWYVQGDVAYGHLVAFNETGYRLQASYATKWYLMNYFRDKVRWLDFGGGAGANASSRGLTSFKSGWSTGTRPAYLCMRNFQPAVYEALAKSKGLGSTDYFPAYRRGELS